jgi:hypothetical protein
MTIQHPIISMRRAYIQRADYAGYASGLRGCDRARWAQLGLCGDGGDRTLGVMLMTGHWLGLGLISKTTYIIHRNLSQSNWHPSAVRLRLYMLNPDSYNLLDDEKTLGVIPERC